MQKILILVSILLYWVGCGGNGISSSVSISAQSDNNALSTLSTANTASASYTINHLDISEIGTVFVEGVALDISLGNTGEFAYMATGSEGLSVVDISNPYNPVVIGNYDAPQYVNHVEVIDNIAYVTYIAKTWDDYTSLSAYNVANPYEAQFLGYFEGYKSNNHKLYTKDGLVYYIDNEGFKVVREKDYEVIGSYDLFDTAYAFVMKDNIAYIANGRNGLTILKVGEKHFTSTLTNP